MTKYQIVFKGVTSSTTASSLICISQLQFGLPKRKAPVNGDQSNWLLTAQGHGMYLVFCWLPPTTTVHSCHQILYCLLWQKLFTLWCNTLLILWILLTLFFLVQFGTFGTGCHIMVLFERMVAAMFFENVWSQQRSLKM